MNGKSKCKNLKEIRRRIAEENDIAYVTSECRFQGDCTGTCPKCEAELRYLERELLKRQRTGKAVAVAGIAAALVLGSAGCTDRISEKQEDVPAGDVPYVEQAEGNQNNFWDTFEHEDTESAGEELVLMGDIPVEEETEIELPMGDIALPEEPAGE